VQHFVENLLKVLKVLKTQSFACSGQTAQNAQNCLRNLGYSARLKKNGGSSIMGYEGDDNNDL
jgi:hypothetical protein